MTPAERLQVMLKMLPSPSGRYVLICNPADVAALPEHPQVSYHANPYVERGRWMLSVLP